MIRGLLPTVKEVSMTHKFSRNSYQSVAVPFKEARSKQPSQEELRAAREAELRAAAREYEAELLAMFDRLPKWNTIEGGQVHHHYWNGQKWVEFDLNAPPLWEAESIDLDNLPAPGV
jgi:hypothetical protein